MKIVPFCLITISVLFTCIASAQQVKSVLPKEIGKPHLLIDTIQIKTPGLTREFPYRFPSYDYKNHIFAGLDERTNVINVYDLPTFDIDHSIQLHDRGPHAVQGNMVGSLYYCSPDSIILLQNIPNRLMILNSKAEIVWQRDLSEIFKGNSALNGLMAFGLFDKIGLYFRDNKVFFALRQNQAKQDFLAPMIGYYDFEKDDILTFNIHYPEFYTTNENVGSYHFPYITWYDELILIVFPYSPEIFIYDLQGNLRTHVEKPTRFKVGKAPKSEESRRHHFLNNPLYSGVQPVQDGMYNILTTKGKTPLNPEVETYRSTIVFNRDFSKFYTIDSNDVLLSFGGEYMYYPIPPVQTDSQLMARYRVRME